MGICSELKPSLILEINIEDALFWGKTDLKDLDEDPWPSPSQSSVLHSAIKEPSACDGCFPWLDFACQILFDDGMGQVLLNSRPGGQFGCEMFPSSGVCDNIWSFADTWGRFFSTISELPKAPSSRFIKSTQASGFQHILLQANTGFMVLSFAISQENTNRAARAAF